MSLPAARAKFRELAADLAALLPLTLVHDDLARPFREAWAVVFPAAQRAAEEYVRALEAEGDQP